MRNPSGPGFGIEIERDALEAFALKEDHESSRAGPPDYEDIAAPARDLAAHAPERIVWGSNWPHSQVLRSEDYPADAFLLDTVLGSIPVAHHRKVLVDSPAILSGLPELVQV